MKLFLMAIGIRMNKKETTQATDIVVPFYDLLTASDNFSQDVLSGLSQRPRVISAKYLYDQVGSELFEKITQQPEYYAARAELDILSRHSKDIAQYIPDNATLIDLGSGSSKKIRALLNILKPARYVAVDISQDMLLKSTTQLSVDFPWLEVHALCSDFSEQLDLPPLFADDNLVVFYPGSSIGNFSPDEAKKFLRQIHALVGKNGQLLVGVDLKKDVGILHEAYNDGAGVTAAFNMNLLQRINNELDANINLDQFKHEAFYNTKQSRIEMHLVSTCNQQVSIKDKNFEFSFGESIHTESSYKYSFESFEQLAQGVNFSVEQIWTDQKNYFSGQLLIAQ